ncbi:MAG: 50S ribosomal protein L1 [Candidatus ainarchaeum sp.]|nr:50S ribosomal protein L1 [Candidatus ainarchaeum sp.]
MDRAQIKAAVLKALEGKGSRKFTQSVDLGINFKGVDFSKQDNRMNLDVILPKGIGKEVKVAVFADGQLATDAGKAGADKVYSGADIGTLAANPAKLKELLDYEFLAMPNLMAVVGKSLGQFLGTRGKLPKPILGGNLADLIARTKKTVRVKNKGKFLPVVHVAVGTENMPADDLAENIDAVYDKVKGKVGDYNIKSVYVKLTMGKPAYVTGGKGGAAGNAG